MSTTCHEKPTWRKGDESDHAMMQRINEIRAKRRRYTGPVNKATRKIREERRPRLSRKPLELID